MSWSFVVHVHTRRSFDSMTPAAAIVDRAVSLGIHALAITDHDTWQGSVDALDHVSKRNLPLRIVIASEVASEQGDLIGLFLRDDVRNARAPTSATRCTSRAGSCCCRIRPSGTVSTRSCSSASTWSRSSTAERRARATPGRRRSRTSASLPGLVGPDAHRLGELELARNEFEGEPPGDEAGLKRAAADGAAHVPHARGIDLERVAEPRGPAHEAARRQARVLLGARRAAADREARGVPARMSTLATYRGRPLRVLHGVYEIAGQGMVLARRCASTAARRARCPTGSTGTGARAT